MIPRNSSLQKDGQAHLDSIFDSVKRQIDLWGENAKWKIDLVLLDNHQQQQNVIRPLLSPQQLHPNAITTPSNSNTTSSSQLHLPVTTALQYPWDYTPPANHDWRQGDNDDLQQKLRESIERQKYLENIIWSQAEQIRKTEQPKEEDAIKTMKNIFLMNENEQKNRFKVETEMLEKDIKILSKKLQKMASTLHEIENIQLPAEGSQECLVEDRKVLMRKLYLAELRLSARDAELDYLHQWVDSYKSTTFHKPPKRVRKAPFLLQQQFSPKSSQVRSLEQPLTALDSLGIVADHMLSDPEFDTSKRIRLDDRRSQRSMDSAVALLTMPQLITPQKKDEPPVKKARTAYMRWTEEEDEKLKRAVQKHGSSNWEACAKELVERTNIQCRNRWIRYLEPKSDARQSPSIAALLNTYTPPSPMATPKNAKQINRDLLF